MNGLRTLRFDTARRKIGIGATQGFFWQRFRAIFASSISRLAGEMGGGRVTVANERERREQCFVSRLDMSLSAPAIDVYLTYRCNLRCGHCFVGDNLTTQEGHFPWAALETLIRECTGRWTTRQLTFLGGEPTLFPDLTKAVELAQMNGLSVRLITNGQNPLRKFITSFNGPVRPQIGFSVDGSTAATHDAVRGRGTFTRLIASIALARSLGFPCHFITSISRMNAGDVVPILELADRFEMSYVNLHYVSARGFAPSEIVLSIDEWLKVGSAVENALPRLSTPIRFERTFFPNLQATPCAARERSSLLFFPDGRVFLCPMFMDVPNAHAFLWNERGLEENIGSTETAVCDNDTSVHCPAMRFVNPSILSDATRRGLTVGCIFHKEQLSVIGSETATHDAQTAFA